MRIAFYKNSGRLFDRLIRLWTRGPYSHCEMIFSDGAWFSSSPRDGGCRFKKIDPTDGHWDFVEIPMTEAEERTMRAFCERENGRKYDWLGIVFSQVFPFGIQDKGRWFCSEICVVALQFAGKLWATITPEEIHPNRLHALVLRA